MASVSSSASPAAVPLRVSVRQGATVIRPSVALMLLPSDTMLDALRRALEFADTRKPCEAKIEELCAGALPQRSPLFVTRNLGPVWSIFQYNPSIALNCGEGFCCPPGRGEGGDTNQNQDLAHPKARWSQDLGSLTGKGERSSLLNLCMQLRKASSRP